MFFGNYLGTLDEKGRIHIPSAISRQIKDKGLMMVAPWGDCLAAFPRPFFEQLGERLRELSKDPANMDKVREIVSSTFAGTFKNGKLLIPQELRNGFKLDKKIQIVGMLDHIEIWNKADWENKDLPREKKSIRDDLNDLGLL